MSFRHKVRAAPMRCYLLFPVDGTFQPSQVADSARQLIQAAANLAQGWTGEPVETLAVNAQARHLWRWHDGTSFPLSGLAEGDDVGHFLGRVRRRSAIARGVVQSAQA